MFKLCRLFFNFTGTWASSREPEEYNGKLLITQPGSKDYHLQLNQIIRCGRALVHVFTSHYDYTNTTRHMSPFSTASLLPGNCSTGSLKRNISAPAKSA